MRVLDRNGSTTHSTPSLATHRSHSPRHGSRRGRSRFLLALLTASAASLALPAVWSSAQPPSDPGTRQRIQIRFPDSTAKPQEPTNTSQQVANQPQDVLKPKDGKLTDVGRQTVAPEANRGAQTNQDPITVASEEEKNQKIATDWKDPWLVFFITGSQSGYLEPCGCTGLANQKGGVNRRDTLLTSLKKRGWNVMPIDGGNQVRTDGTQSEIKFQWTTQAFREMGYEAAAYGEKDLKLSDNILVSILDNTGSNSLFVSANVSLLPDFDLRYKVVSVKDPKGRTHKIGITSILGEENTRELLRNGESYFKVEPPIPALKEIAAKLTEEKCDFQILIAHAGLDETRAIVKEVPQFQLVVTSGGYGEPTYRPEVLPGSRSEIVQVGSKGMYAGIFGLFDSADQPTRYQRIALSSQFEDSPRMTDLFGKYQDELKAKSDNTFSSLGLRPLTHPTTREFVGSEKCGDCHSTAYEIWKNTPHAHATESIIEPPERSLTRIYDPECISCHVTGWNPQGVYPYRTGYTSVEQSQQLLGNGCENCHGPGSKHVEAELGDIEADKQLLETLRSQMKLSLERAQDKCLECHDIDNSPDFHKTGAFETYWDQVKHYGKD